MDKIKWEEATTKVFEALGAASVCWEDLSQTGVFKSEEAKQIGDDLMKYLRENFETKRDDFDETARVDHG